MHNCIFEHVSLYIKRVTSGDATQRDHSGDGSQESHPAGQQGSKLLDAVASLVLTHVSNCQAHQNSSVFIGCHMHASSYWLM